MGRIKKAITAALLGLVLSACKPELAIFIPNSLPSFDINNDTNLVSDETYTLSWSGTNKAQTYDVVIAKDELCTDVIFEKSGIKGTSVKVEALDDGAYFLCVYARSGKGHLPAKNNGISLVIDRTAPLVSVPTKVLEEKLPFNPAISIVDLTETTVVWTQDSGSGIVTFENDRSLKPGITASKNGLYSIKALVTDKLGHSVEQIYQFYWNGTDTNDLSFISLVSTGAAANGFINNDEKTGMASLWTLSQAGATKIAYTEALIDSSQNLLCDENQIYNKTSIPRAVDLPADGIYSVCVKLSDAAGHTAFGKSESVTRDTIAPLFASLNQANAAVDGIISDSEKLLVNPMWTLAASGQIRSEFTVAMDDSGSSLICDESSLYNQVQIANPSSLSVDGSYAICVRMIDAAGNFTIAKSTTIVRNVVMPIFTSLARVNTASNGSVNDLEKSSTLPLWILTQSGGAAVSYTSPLNDSTSSIICDSSKLYDQSSIADAASVPSDGEWAICARVTSAFGNSVYGKSQLVVRDTVYPVFTSLALMNAAVDGYISNSEKALTTALWSLTASGYVSAHYTSASADAGGTLSCDSSLAYLMSSSSIASSLVTDGPYASCVKLVDAAGNVSYGKGAQVVRDTTGPVFTSLLPANAASDGFINGSELTSALPMWALTETGSVTTRFTTLFEETGGLVACNAGKTYSQTSIPVVTDLTADGHYTICVQLIDNLGNETYGKAGQVVRGTSGPIFGSLTQVNEASDGFINNAEKNATTSLWVLTESGSDTIEYTVPLLDNSGTALCDASRVYSQSTIPLVNVLPSDGSWIICVKLSDLSTNVAYGKAYPIVRDVVLPVFTSLARAGAASDGYINDSEKMLINPMWALSSSGESSAMFSSASSDTGATLTCNGATVYDQSLIAAPSTLSSDGAYAICVRLSDDAGNTVYGKSAQITRKTLGSAFTSLALANAATDGYINDSEKSLSTALWTLAASDYVTASYTSALIDSTLTCDSTKTFNQSSIALPSNLGSDGTYALCVKLVDVASNTTFGKSSPVVLDTEFPLISSFATANVAADGYINNNEKANASALLSLTASGYATASYTVALDDSTGTFACDASQSYSASGIALTSSLSADGTYAICVRLADLAGNLSYGKSAQFIRKTSAPVFTSLLRTGDANDGYINAAEKTNSTALWALTATGQTSTSYTSALSDSPTAVTCDGTKTYGQSSIATAASLTVDGDYSLCVQLTDLAGNITYGKAAAINRDTLYPFFSSMLGINLALDGYIKDSEKDSTLPMLALTASGYNQAEYTAALSDASGTLVCDAGKSYGASIPIISSMSTDGAYVVCVKLSDLAGNITYEKSQTIIRDIVAPSVTVTTLSTSDLNPPLSGSIDDSTATVQITLNNRNYNAVNNGSNWNIADNLVSLTGTGVHNVIATVRDPAGNVGTDSTTSELTITAPAFVSTWKTDNAGVSSNLSIKLPLRGTGSYNFVVQWGDGKDDVITASNDPAAIHTYTSSGTYTVKISGQLTGWAFKTSGDQLKLLTISNWGPLNFGNDTGYFYGAANLTISATDLPNLTGTTTFQDIFRNCGALTAVPNIGTWNTGAITNFKTAFMDASTFNSPIGAWNMSSATTTTQMFESASAFNQNLSAWDTSAVTTMNSMFKNASVFNGNIGTWNVSAVTSMSAMFEGSAVNQSLSTWNTAAVTNMAYMFKNATSFNGNISTWNVSAVTSMLAMFEGSPINQSLSLWNTGAVTEMSYMFKNAWAFNGNITTWDTSKVVSMIEMFYGASYINQDLSNWVTSSVTSMNSMFFNAIRFNGNVSPWNVSKVTDMGNLFRNAKVFNKNLSTWNTSLVTKMSGMFKNADVFNGDISNFDVSKVTTFDSMFQGAWAFNQNIGGWNTIAVTNMYNMFNGATSFNANISGWNTANVINMGGMFYTAPSFNQPIINWNVAKVTQMTYMFSNSTSFNQDLGNWSPILVTDMLSIFSNTGMTSANYSATLVGWNTKTLKSSVVFGAGSIKYLSTATAARNNLTGTRLWTITDGGLGP